MPPASRLVDARCQYASKSRPSQVMPTGSKPCRAKDASQRVVATTARATVGHAISGRSSVFLVALIIAAPLRVGSMGSATGVAVAAAAVSEEARMPAIASVVCLPSSLFVASPAAAEAVRVSLRNVIA